MQQMRAVWVGLWVAGLAFVGLGCEEGTQKRACDPVRQVGCGRDRQCVVDAEGVPRCAELSVQMRGEGQACARANHCAPGLGCVRVAGVARCSRFCRSAEQPDPCVDVGPGNGSAAFPDVDELLRDDARCAAVLPARDDIGVCVLPCRPLVAGDCPEGSTCGHGRGMATLSCVPTGEVGPLGACGASSGQCEADLICADVGGMGRICVPPVRRQSQRPCEAGGYPVALAGVAPTVEGRSAQVCTPCLAVGSYTEDGRIFGRCEGEGGAGAPLHERACALDEGGRPEAICPCGGFGPRADLSDLNPVRLRDLGYALAQLPGAQAGGPQVAVRRDGGGQWRWLDGEAVAQEAWAGEAPAGGCVGLTPEGLAGRPCDAVGQQLCQAP